MQDKLHWRKIEDIFERALELPHEGRASFVADACGGDVALRDEVNALLAADEKLAIDTSANDFIDTPQFSLTPLAQLFPNAKKRSADSFLGRRIGAYRLTHKLGTGGMGAVFLAERADGEFQKQVAVKIINCAESDAANDEALLNHFRHERQILATLNHPNIAQLFDGGTTKEKLPYFIMEYVEGEPIVRYCENRNLPLNNRLHLFLRVCAAIEYAHGKQLLHRDIKPSNVLVTEDGTPKLLDFGIARLLTDDLTGDTASPPGVWAMTPEYASPEQLRGESLTTASDVYSLGVLLYELLTGELPYRFASREPRVIARVIGEGSPEPPCAKNSVRLSFRTLDAGAASVLDAITLKALAKNAHGRFASATELKAAIERFVAETGGEANKIDSLAQNFDEIVNDIPDKARTLRGPATEEAKPKSTTANSTNGIELSIKPQFAAFNPVGWRQMAASLVVIMALSLATVLALRALTRPANTADATKERQHRAATKALAVLPFKNISSNSPDDGLGVTLADSLTERLGAATSFKVLSANTGRALTQRAGDAMGIGREFNVSHILRGSFAVADQKARIDAELVDTHTNQIIWVQHFTTEEKNIIPVRLAITEGVWQALKINASPEERARSAKTYTKNPLAVDFYRLARAQMMSRSAENLYRAEKLFVQAIEKDPSFAPAYVGLADVYTLLNIYETPPPANAYLKAKEYIARALSLDDELAEGHTTLGDLKFYYEHDRAAAESEYRRAIELNPSNPKAHHWFALALAAMNRNDEAMKEIDEARALDPLSPAVHTARGIVNYYGQRYEQALIDCREALRLNENFIPAHKVTRWIFQATGNYKHAFAAFLKESNASGDDKNRLHWLLCQAQVEAAGGNGEKARDLLSQGLAGLRTENNQHAYPYEAALAFAALGDKEQTLVWLERAAAVQDRGFNFIAVETRFDWLRGDARFAKLIEKLRV